MIENLRAYLNALTEGELQAFPAITGTGCKDFLWINILAYLGYLENKFYNIDTCAECYKKIYCPSLRMFTKS